MKKPLALMCLCAYLAATGCGAGRTPPPRGATAAQDQQIYELYRQYMEVLNQERQQAGLPPLTVRSYEDFRRAPGTD